jgi:hypothetical protein
LIQHLSEARLANTTRSTALRMMGRGLIEREAITRYALTE